MSYGGVVYDNRQATLTTKAKDKLWRHGNWDSVHGSIPSPAIRRTRKA
jgi:hypothetical protein